MHPRTTSKLKGIDIPPNIRIMAPLGFYDFNQLLKQSFCVLSDSGTAAEEGLFYKVPNVSLRMATERMETIESGATIVSGMEAENIVEAVTLAVSLPWSARYEFEEDYSPSSVVVNAIRTKITNFF
jgi:UDP-N-acetylglucosamine 2-epimerase (non-hydrolysing)